MKPGTYSLIVSCYTSLAAVLVVQFTTGMLQGLLLGALIGAAGSVSFSLGRKDALLWVNSQLDQLRKQQ